MDYLKESPPVIRDYLVYLETIMGRSPRTVNEYYLDLRTFFRFILKKRGLASPAADFSAISLEPVVGKKRVLPFSWFVNSCP